MPDTEHSPLTPFDPEIRRGRIDKLSIFEVSEQELEVLQRGSPDSLFLNFALALLSAALSFSAALATTTITSDRVFTVFVVIVVVGYVGGLLLLFLWWRSHTSVLAIVRTIRNRLPPEGVSESSPLG